MATSTDATAKQVDLILSLGTRILGHQVRSLYDMRSILSGSHRSLSVGQASVEIDHLRELLAENQRIESAAATAEPTTAPEGGMDATTAVHMLGKTVKVTAASGREWTGSARSIDLREGDPALTISTTRSTVTIRLHRITSWVEL